MTAPRAEKTCARCGRRMTWRKRWASVWDEVRYCSDACRAARPASLDAALEETIRTLLDARRPEASICPSEAARAVGGDAWRDLMEPARRGSLRPDSGQPRSRIDRT
ncbi:MAG: hypothetical protein NVS2B9_15910 [Myxococcales bacterium]